LHEAAEFVIGNLDEDGYLAASEEELAAAFSQPGPEGVEAGPGNGLDTGTARRSSWCARPSTWCSILTRPAWAPAICASAC
jgi:hypothetical protein